MSLRESVFARREEICIRRPCLYLAHCVPDSHVYSTEVVYRDRAQAWVSGVRIPAGARTLSSKLPDLLWGSHSLLFKGYRGSFSGGKVAAAWSWPQTSPPMLRWRMSGATTSTLPICLQGMERCSFSLPLPCSRDKIRITSLMYVYRNFKNSNNNNVINMNLLGRPYPTYTLLQHHKLFIFPTRCSPLNLQTDIISPATLTDLF